MPLICFFRSLILTHFVCVCVCHFNICLHTFLEKKIKQSAPVKIPYAHIANDHSVYSILINMECPRVGRRHKTRRCICDFDTLQNLFDKNRHILNERIIPKKLEKCKQMKRRGDAFLRSIIFFMFSFHKQLNIIDAFSKYRCRKCVNISLIFEGVP